jgi:putrescine---pyruvate transaminase
MGAIEIDPPGLAAKVAVAARERGVMPRALVSSVAVSPPLTIQQPELELIGSTLRDALDAVLEQAAPHNGAASSAARSTTAR